MANIKYFATIPLTFSTTAYPVFIGDGLLSDAKNLMSFVKGSQVLIVTNDTIAPLYLKRLQQCFSHLQCDTVIIPDGETYKNQASLDLIYAQLIEHNHHRDTTLIALGGGVVGDITGFAAATYQRGVSYIHVPTTLLAQVDASVGGKTAINYLQAKNVIGSFHQPIAVFIDVSTLRTLPDREFRAGFGEIIKYGLLVGGAFLTELSALLDEGVLTLSTEQLARLVEQCIRIKASFVEADEKDNAKRALLNLGHTFAHALEASTGFSRWLHGEAVAIGLVCAARLSWLIGSLDENSWKQVEQLILIAGLPHQIPADIDLNRLEQLFILDKKNKDNQTNFVLMRRLGECYIDKRISRDAVFSVLSKNQLQ